MIYRTYFTKDNTLYSSNPRANLGYDPILELGYGGVYGFFSRAIFDFSVAKIKQKIEAREIIENNIKHTLRLYNTYKYDNNSLGYKNERPDGLPSSFTLELFIIKDAWDEGSGYSLKNKADIMSNPRYSEQGSSFLNAMTNTPWRPNYYEVYKEIRFDIGDENVDVDITDLVNDVISESIEFHGMGLKFKDVEGFKSEYPFSICFYGKDTHTFFRPYVETSWEENIVDNRCDYFTDTTNKLMLYSRLLDEPINLDEPPTSVEIFDDNDNLITTITNVKHEYKGIYSIIPPTNLPLNKIYYDLWKGLKYNGQNIGDVEMEFDIISNNNLFNFSSKLGRPNHRDDLKINLTGIKEGEVINNDERRALSVSTTTYNGEPNNGLITMDLYIKQGVAKVFIFENEPLIKTAHMSVKYLDMRWFTPQQYYIDLYNLSNGSKIFLKTIAFTIISNKGYDYVDEPLQVIERVLADNGGRLITVEGKRIILK